MALISLSLLITLNGNLGSVCDGCDVFLKQKIKFFKILHQTLNEPTHEILVLITHAWEKVQNLQNPELSKLNLKSGKSASKS